MNNNTIGKCFLYLVVLLLLPVWAYAEKPNLAVGVGYPYILAKYNQLEVKYATGNGISVFAGRYYLNILKPKQRAVKAFIGAEAGYVKFNTFNIKGKGYEGGFFVGGEYRIIDSLSLSVDIAPVYITLKSEDDFKASGLEIVTNIALYYYFTGK